MTLEIQYRDGTAKSSKPLEDQFEWKEALSGLLKDENKIRPIRSFNLMDSLGVTLQSGVFTVVGQILTSN